ncbi:DUF1206 domain-containing protein [Microbacterium sp. zg.Y625]|uniref:DUF1206 domain-containing protein n=1 Tax=Microbacterium jiangjiandongii TaxID=3049071 RepID=UPI00214B18FA|nr:MULTISPECIES: DUF1206 domain-containing protein [unclassified Microbacterium]MCR2793915.1 DUF1206 domain-containing protein [Microbacterium sp. zg.Y625]MCR2816005.1 DUF1206 domain-containing protein [Microbacterium sp. zg.Y843]WIM26249.1 DUF1206 domain-containing protein [Microbacterium sp. zg-Y625]
MPDAASPPATRQVARDVAHHPAARFGARAGYAANGVVHGLIGSIALVVAFGGTGESDQTGALKAIAEAPLGFAALWVLAVALWALGTWHLAEGVLARAPEGDVKGAAKKWGVRASEWGQAAAFSAIGFLAAAVALGARPNAEEAAERASEGVLTIAGGSILLTLVGLGVAVGGISFVVMGVMRSFHSKLDIPDTPLGHAVVALGVVGFVAKGIALLIVGILLLASALTIDPSTAGGLDGALQVLLGMMFGPALVAVVGAGFVAYGAFCLFRARYATL